MAAGLLIGLAIGIVQSFMDRDPQEEKIILLEDFPETGTVLDISDQNGGSALLVPGDIIYVKLVGEAASGKQWTAVIPTTKESLVLMDHKLTDLNNEEVDFFTDEWWIKVVEPDVFTLQYNYGLPFEDVEQTFTFDITIQ